MTTISIIDIAQNLIKSIEKNKTSGQLPSNNFCGVIPFNLIEKEFEELREWVITRTLEKITN